MEDEYTESVARRMTAEKIELQGCKSGLGVVVVGGRNMRLRGQQSDFGIFIKDVLEGRLGHEDGRLQKGDQLLEANGKSLVGVSKNQAVTIIKDCCKTDTITLLVSRDARSQSDFKRLSHEIQSPSPPPDTPKSHFPLHPEASSTPMHVTAAAELPLDIEPTEALRSSVVSNVTMASTATTVTTTDVPAQRNSSSSELTDITTTDISSHGEDDEEAAESQSPTRDLELGTESVQDSGYSPGFESKTDGPLALSDVAVSVPEVDVPEANDPLVPNGEMDSDEDVPPPPPTTLPPGELDDLSEDDVFPPPLLTSERPIEDEESSQPGGVEPAASDTAVTLIPQASQDVLQSHHLSSRLSPEGKSVSSPPPSSPLPLPSSTPPLHHSTITIPKGVAGLGLRIEGGTGHSSDPHIVIGRILAGSDAAKDGRLQAGDRILSVNGESFVNITRERALTILTQLKGKTTVKSYTIEYERPLVTMGPNDNMESPPPLPPQTMTSESLFNSDTLPVSVAPATTATALPAVSYSGLSPPDATGSTPPTEVVRVKSVLPRRYMGKKEQVDKTKYDSMSQRLSMDPTAKVSLAKLDLALKFMGYTMTPEQKEVVHTTLEVDENGKVIFSEFVKLAQEMFAFKLESSHLEAGLVFALTQKESMELPTYPKKAGSMEALSYKFSSVATPSPTKLSGSHPHISSQAPPQDTSSPSQKEEEIKYHREQLLKLGRKQDEHMYKKGTGPQPGTRDSHLTTVSDTQLTREAGLTKPRNEILGTKHYTGTELSDLNEAQVLQRRVGLLEAALREKERELELQQQVVPGSSRETQQLRRQILQNEENLEEKDKTCKQLQQTIQHMEAEIAGLRRKPAEQHLPTLDLQRRLATLDCQLRKEQAITRRFQVTTEKLMQFVETCHEALVNSPEASKILYHRHGKGEAVQHGDAVTGNPRPPPYLSKHAKVTSVTLAQEAQETMLAIHKMLEIKNLPYGWEGAYTEEGEKYYMNHETQTTSWVHPVTHMTAVPSSSSSTPSSHSRRSSQSSPHPLPVRPPTIQNRERPIRS